MKTDAAYDIDPQPPRRARRSNRARQLCCGSRSSGSLQSTRWTEASSLAMIRLLSRPAPPGIPSWGNSGPGHCEALRKELRHGTQTKSLNSTAGTAISRGTRASRAPPAMWKYRTALLRPLSLCGHNIFTPPYRGSGLVRYSVSKATTSHQAPKIVPPARRSEYHTGTLSSSAGGKDLV